MLYYLNGTLAMTELNTAVIDCGGVGYKLTISGNTLGRLASKLNTQIRLYTYMQISEANGVELFGFYDTEELSAFKLLLSVSGVGPKAAMSILTLLTPDRFALAVTGEDAKTLSRAQGIGAKTAARIVLELKDKMNKEFSGAIEGSASEDSQVGAESGKLSDAQNTLLVLGYSRSEAIAALRGIDISALSLEDIIREALKRLTRQ